MFEQYEDYDEELLKAEATISNSIKHNIFDVDVNEIAIETLTDFDAAKNGMVQEYRHKKILEKHLGEKHD